MERTREYFRSMVSQRAIKQTFFEGEKEYNASWDYAVSPEGRHYVSICAEGPKIDAMVYEYIPETCELKKCVDTKTDIFSYPRTIRPSKVHTCMSFMEDGRMIFNNHTTAGAPEHPDWMAEAYWSHPWEGYPGSHVMVYDPVTGKTEDYGIPVPRETIYGGSYDPIHRAYYFSGYYRGHGYRLDLDTRKVTDYGQFVEFSTYLHTKGPDGNVYLSTDSGRMLRYNVHNQKAEILNAMIPLDPDVPDSKSGNVMAFAAIGPDDQIYIAPHRNEYIYAYDYHKDEIAKVGSPVPSWYREQYKGRYMIFGMDFDKYGVLWYGLKILGNCMRFVSWDIFNGGEPVDHGIVGTVAHAAWNFSQVKIVDDVFYGSTTNHDVDGPAVIALDLQMLREDVDKPRERGMDKIIYRGTPDADIYPTGEQLTGRAALDATEGIASKVVTGGHTFSDGILRTNPRNNEWIIETGPRFVTKLWYTLGDEYSQVYEVFHEDGKVIAIAGGNGKFYRCEVFHGRLLKYEEIEYTPDDGQALADKYKDVILPAPAGRSWLAVASAEAELADGSVLVGTKGGGLAVVKDGKSYSLGFVSTTGPVRGLSASPDKRTVFGVAGDPEEFGFVFSYNMDFGVVGQGMLFFGDEEGETDDLLACSCEPCCIDYAPDGNSFAVGVRDRLGCVYEYYFEDKVPGFSWEEALK